MKGPDDREMARFRAEDDLRTLVEANKIKSDKKRLAMAVKMAKEQKKALEGIES